MSSDFQEFKELPPINLEYKKKNENFRKMFTGLWDKILIEV